GGGGGVPAGYLPGVGPWAYRCSCPDYGFSESRYQVATAPSHRRDRSWNQTRPLSPCKHIVSSAKAVGDNKTVLDWTRQFRGDSTGREFNESPYIRNDYTLRNLDRQMYAEQRKAVAATRRALATDRRAERAQRGARYLSDRLGRINRMNSDGTTTSSTFMGRFGESLHIANSPALERIRRDTTMTYDQANRMNYTVPKLAPRQPLVSPTAEQMATDPRFWSLGDVGYQIGYEIQSIVRPNYNRTSAELYVGGSGPVLGSSRNNRSIRIPNPDTTPGAQDSVLIPGTRANSRRYGVSLR
ncbi:hypothetical protein IQ273_31250, partial [Nodosilinea sp. LEGE 07298]|uniref:hypothetical protein n=1 Tax=Nodosilinea sp. LEGE 07298 TaxID=2777970 RepID=UPI001881FA1B